MLKIRLKRIGRRQQPSYRIVVVEASKPRDGRTVEDLGSYNPRNKPSTFDVNTEKAKAWIFKGAQPTDTIAQYFVKLGLMEKPKKGSTKPSTEKKTKENKE
ncbi:30S ribosomal protein S16 [Candidatus Microgenomates bacterium]|jgi:small subunit ribosomal protein S16|nr:30S ribosomal protein S16 [Candidatus Microgenomates bacterium]